MKNAEIKLRISEREKEEIKAKAEQMQMSMSEYILYCVRKNESEDKRMEKYSVEIARNDELVDNSSVYFTNKKEMIDYCKNHLIEENEKYYVTVFDGDTWFYDEQLTKKANESEE